MRTTPVYKVDGTQKSIACFFVEISTSSTYVLEPINSLFYSKTKCRKWATDFVNDCRANGTARCEVRITPMYRDEKTGKIFPGRGQEQTRIGYAKL